MCHQCNYVDLLKKANLLPTPNRLKILEVIGSNTYPLNAQEIFETVKRNGRINRVTVYRILELLVEKGLLDRISGGGRSFFYGPSPNQHHPAHAHFYCRNCGSMQCLRPESIVLDPAPLRRIFPGKIDHVDIRVDGLCKNCLKSFPGD
jgi:Fur family ferric uptake transcriptional regulator